MQEVEAIVVEVNIQPIELYKVLKIAQAVSGGGEAKQAISGGYVAVNGEVETRKRRKLYANDVVEFNHEFYVVFYEPSAVIEPPLSAPKAISKPANKRASKAPKAARGKISFS